ncbi:MAG: ATP-binding protein, partial [Chloroflexota bacterium]
CGLLGWASTSSLVTVMGWFVYSYKNLQTNLEEIRQQRAQLNRALRQLDQANQMLQRANASLVAARRAAEEAERFKAEFVANVSHELRTPLNLIIGFAQVIVTSPESYGGEPLPGAYRSDIYAIYNSAKHLRALVDDVLDMGRLDANKIALVRQPVPVAALVNEIETMVRDYVTAKGLALRVHLEPDLPILQIDQLRIRQVLLNLLVNAVRFTEKGFIQLQVSRQEHQVMFRVQDTGRGIAPEELLHIFEPFHTTTDHHAETPWHTGTGLGIPISKKFVELHGGQMGVESIPFEGTTFWFALPCETCGEPNVPSVKPRAAPPDAEEMERIVVVVTPDDGVTATLQRQIADFKFVAAKNLAAGVAMAQELQATALITDETPDDLPTIDIPIVNVPLPTREKIASALGARDLLTKPVTAEQLIAALDRSGRTAQRVLIADEDPGLARLFRRILRPRVAGQNLLEAYTSTEVLTRLDADHPDVILLSVDLQQPNVRQMLAQPEYRDVWIILIGEKWDEWTRVLQPLQIFRSSGFRSGELMQTLQAILGSLANSTAPTLLPMTAG